MSNKVEATFHGAAIDVVCMGCGQPLTIARVGETACTCGVQHTFVPSRVDDDGDTIVRGGD